MSNGPVVPAAEARLACRPGPELSVRLTDGFWLRRQLCNREVTIPHGMRMLQETGTLENFRIAAGDSDAEYRMPLFRDSDLYKVLEAIAWDRSHGPLESHEQFLRSSAALIARAQEHDGYLNTYVRVVRQGERFADPAMGHELYCAGHLFQAAIADARTADGDPALLPVARRFASYLARTLPTEQPSFVPGHPEVETALVELYRTLGDRQLLELAAELVERRGHQRLSWRSFKPEYFQDDVAVADARTVRGHAVRALYLLAGVADLYTEAGDERLRAALFAQWDDMVSSKTYLTGGLGSRHADEAFGEPFELPPDRAYCETCASIASIMWNWRMLLLTGEGRFADLMERTLYNGFLSGVGLDGTSFFYVNPLQTRSPRTREPWYECACCPPNTMRLLASLEHYLATATDAGVQVHHYASSQIRWTPEGAEPFALTIETAYPFEGEITLRIDRAPAREVELALRVPAWAPSASLELNGRARALEPSRDGYLRLRRNWTAADEVVLRLPVQPHAVSAREEVDAVRGCVAFERGPLVYCVEGLDVPGGLAGLAVDPSVPPIDEPGVTVAGETVTAIRLPAVASPRASRPGGRPATTWPYARLPTGASPAGPAATDPARRTDVRALPYFAWANRGPSEMRVWLPDIGCTTSRSDS